MDRETRIKKETVIKKTQIIVEVDETTYTCKEVGFVGTALPPALVRKVLLDAAETLLEMRLQDILTNLIKQTSIMLDKTGSKQDFNKKIMEK